ncbi:GNAT family N-acetyltransferase [Brachybacterium sp. JHP9]|uniref:GNAT family N-acetyltransferase n=1 Tax=Brachybacterium equifaecis TaxID=2910770 RepID=A0ABT0QXX0_9MICO|nr:GNAT family N-acetyltransferase [Brachybacterium equifaecis]MCL6422520.1 GNAT family N-acetyltransferase [Brachybacterium equifaecis]
MHLNEFADRVEKLSERYADVYGVDRSPEWALLKLTEEIGELAQAHLTASGQSRDRGLDEQARQRRVAAELGDVLGMCLVYARLAGIDPEAAIARKWFPHEIEVRPFEDPELQQLTDSWPVPGGVHEAHAGAQLEGRSEYLVAWHDDVAVGSAVLRTHGYEGAQGRAAHPGAMEICHLQVRPERREQGVGTSLLQAAERRAAALGAREIAVGVADDNPGARRLYERLGYRASGIVDVSEHDWTADDGTVHHERESDEMMLKALGTR